MNKKILVWMYLVVLSIGTIVNLYMPKVEAASREEIVIPGDAIRLRILANSDREADQELKRKVRDAVNEKITEWVSELTSLEEARTVIKDHLPEINDIARRVLDENGSSQEAKAEFGKVKFPTKLYGQFLYPAGDYEAILITLGEGKGANWWCVLYPPLCFLDFSNGTAVRSDGFEDDAEAAKEPKKEATEKISEEKLSEKKDSDQPAKEESHKHEEKKARSDKKPEREVGREENSGKKKQDNPVYAFEDEEPVKVKFFVVEMWEKLIN